MNSLNSVSSDQPLIILTPDEQMQLFSLLPADQPSMDWGMDESAKKVNYCRRCFIKFEKKANYTDHIRSIHQKKAKIGLGKGSFSVTILRHADGHFYCPCELFKTVHPKPLAGHMKRCKYALNMDPGVKAMEIYNDPYVQTFHQPIPCFSDLSQQQGYVNNVDWLDAGFGGNLAESA